MQKLLFISMHGGLMAEAMLSQNRGVGHATESFAATTNKQESRQHQCQQWKSQSGVLTLFLCGSFSTFKRTLCYFFNFLSVCPVSSGYRGRACCTEYLCLFSHLSSPMFLCTGCAGDGNQKREKQRARDGEMERQMSHFLSDTVVFH